MSKKGDVEKLLAEKWSKLGSAMISGMFGLMGWGEGEAPIVLGVPSLELEESIAFGRPFCWNIT